MIGLILFVWVLGLVVILGICRFSGLWPLKVTVPQLFIIKSLVLSYGGYPFLLLQVFEHRVTTGISDPALLGTCVVAAAYALVIPLLVHYALGGALEEYGERPCRDNGDVSVAFWVVVMVIIAAVTAVYLQKVPRVALFEAFSDGEVAAARSEMTNNFEGKYHWYSIAFQDMAWLVALVLYGIAKTRDRPRYWGVFGIAFALAVFGLLMTGQKSPLVWFVGTLVLMQVALKPGARIKGIAALSLGVVVVGLLFGTYLLFKGVSGGQAMEGIASRALTGQIAGGYNYQLIFPEQVAFLMGRSMPNPGGLLPFEHYSLATEAMARASPETFAAGIVGSQPTMYWGEAYANFGWWGVGLLPLFVGLALLWAERLVLRIRSKEIRAAAVVWVGLQMSGFAVSGFSWIVFPAALAIGAGAILLHELVAERRAGGFWTWR